MFQKSESIAKLSSALVAAQSKMSDAVKDSANPFFKSKFADLNSVREACTPALNAQKIAILQPVVRDNAGHDFVATTLLHESGEWISSLTAIVCAKQNDPQAYGSAISYARRYGLQALVSLGTADDDGEGAMARNTGAPAPAKTFTPTKPAAGGFAAKKATPAAPAPATKEVF